MPQSTLVPDPKDATPKDVATTIEEVRAEGRRGAIAAAVLAGVGGMLVGAVLWAAIETVAADKR